MKLASNAQCNIGHSSLVTYDHFVGLSFWQQRIWVFLGFFVCLKYKSLKWNVWSYHVTYAFQSESTLCSCLNVRELLAQSRSKIWRLTDCNGNRTCNQLVCKRAFNHLAKLAWMYVSLFWKSWNCWSKITCFNHANR